MKVGSSLISMSAPTETKNKAANMSNLRVEYLTCQSPTFNIMLLYFNYIR